jgi:heme exporter protein B
VGTLLSTITINTRGKDVMLAVLFIPLSFPLLWSCVAATTCVMVGADGYMGTFTTAMALAGVYDVAMILISWALYDYVVSA